MDSASFGFRLFRWRRAVLVAAVLALGVAFGAGPIGRLRARLPDPLNDNTHIEVLTEAPAPPVGTPLVTLRPRLEVLGVVEAELPDAPRPLPSDRVLRVSIYPEARERIREDARFVVRVTTPDLLEIFSTHFTPERRRALAARIERWYRAHETALARAGARVRAIVAEQLGADELGMRLRNDPLVRNAVGAAIEREVIEAIDWRQVVTDFLESPAGDATGRLLGETRIVPTLWEGLRAGYAARLRRALGSVEPAPLEPPEDETEDGESGTARWLARQLSALFAPDAAAFERAALDEARRHIEAAVPKHEAELGARFSDLGLQLLEEHEVERKLVNAGRRLVHDEGLRTAILERYGPEAWQRLERLGAALATDTELATLLREAADRALELLVAVLREVALDETGTGPNPLVVAFVRARMLGRTQPLLVLESPGVGAPVEDGSRFEARTR
ncbi:MAG: hypothetical protein D6776_03730 [Planctomycetota bacterium]|nr:MAG: hypothetical protein D6776_03730 [Planctomycetota bacterium]